MYITYKDTELSILSIICPQSAIRVQIPTVRLIGGLLYLCQNIQLYANFVYIEWWIKCTSFIFLCVWVNLGYKPNTKKKKTIVKNCLPQLGLGSYLWGHFLT